MRVTGNLYSPAYYNVRALDVVKRILYYIMYYSVVMYNRRARANRDVPIVIRLT